MASVKALRGADIKLYINGRLFPTVTSFRFAASTGLHAIMGIDQSTPFELASGACNIKGSMELIRVRGSGGIQGAGLAAPERDVLRQKYFSMTVVDRVTDTVILQIDEASVSEESWQAPIRAIMTGSVSFEGLGWVNEVAF